MKKWCRSCRFHLDNESNPYARCLIYYNNGIAVEKLKKGLIGQCDKYKSRNKEDVVNE